MRRVKLLKNGDQCEESTGCYGGIRKLYSEEEIQRWENILSRGMAGTRVK